MPKLTIIDLKHTPIFLTSQESANPFDFIRQFYGLETDLGYAREELKRWFRSAISQKQLLSKDEMVSLIGFKDYYIKLVEASYIIYSGGWEEISNVVLNQEQAKSLLNPAYFHDPRYEVEHAWYYFPRHLSYREVANPFHVLSKMFKRKPLYKWRKTIEDLFSAAISNCDAHAVVEEGEDIYSLFDFFFKLLEATHLIYVRLKVMTN